MSYIVITNLIGCYFKQPKRESVRRVTPSVTNVQVSTFEPNKSEFETPKTNIHQTQPLLTTIIPKQERSSLFSELEWDPNLEYDPLHPTDYDKIIRGMNHFIVLHFNYYCQLFSNREERASRNGD